MRKKIIDKIVGGEELLSIPETAKILGITPQTVRKYVKSGKIEAIPRNPKNPDQYTKHAQILIPLRVVLGLLENKKV